MNEKRFKLDKDTEWWFVKDNTIKVDKFGFRDDLTGEDAYRGLKQELTEEETVKLLNKLNDDCKNWEKSFKILCEENKQLKKAVRRQQKSNEECSKYIEEVAKKNKELEEELYKFKEYVFSNEKILCYSCANCISKGIYKVECSEKGKVDVHSTCFLYWKNEVKLND